MDDYSDDYLYYKRQLSGRVPQRQAPKRRRIRRVLLTLLGVFVLLLIVASFFGPRIATQPYSSINNTVAEICIYQAETARHPMEIRVSLYNDDGSSKPPRHYELQGD